VLEVDEIHADVLVPDKYIARQRDRVFPFDESQHFWPTVDRYLDGAHATASSC
jgi:hypothetical protein